ncbi:MAG: hypothetical protein EA403_14895 [Spirochaetaceae bacterium]|nr:MAG: hypothetical protein EA403_14895 [Spirochaetaceae bacterium]
MRGILFWTVLVAMVVVMAAVVVPVVRAQAGRSAVNVTRDGVAIEGYDPVAYHLLGRPTIGDPAITHRWMGAIWRFANAEHRDRFAADPDRYAPQYGGYCSWAVSRGTTASIDPNAWHIEDGRLYLNLNPRINRRFVADVHENIGRAEANWPRIRERLSGN